MKKIIVSLLACSFVFFTSAQDTAVVSKIKDEGLKNSKVMDIVFHLTDVSGPRLTASPGFMRAANWAKDELTKIIRERKKLRVIRPSIFLIIFVNQACFISL